MISHIHNDIVYIFPILYGVSTIEREAEGGVERERERGGQRETERQKYRVLKISSGRPCIMAQGMGTQRILLCWEPGLGWQYFPYDSAVRLPD